MKSLNHLPVGHRAVVDAIRPGSPSSNLLSALGILPGRTLEVSRYAPLGDPMAIIVDGHHQISLRRADAADVTIREAE